MNLNNSDEQMMINTLPQLSYLTSTKKSISNFIITEHVMHKNKNLSSATYPIDWLIPVYLFPFFMIET